MSAFRVSAVRDLGPQFVENGHGMVGQDGAYSIPLGEVTPFGEKALWFFGDTLIGCRVPGESLWYPDGIAVGHADMSGKGEIRTLVNNAGLLLRGRTGSAGLRDFHYICDTDGNIRPLIPREAGEDPDWFRIWCLHGCAIGGRIYLYYIKVHMLAHGPFPVNFEIVGSGLAVGSRSDMLFRRVKGTKEGIFWKAGEPQFGSSVLRGPDSYLYLYGVALGPDNVQRCSLARVGPEAIEDPNAYAYLSGPDPQWSRDVGSAFCLFTGVPNELSVSFNKYLNAYLAVHSLDLSGDIVARTAPAPWGPWSPPTRLAHVHVEPDPTLPYVPWVYAGKEHPELSEHGGKVIYITYIQFEEYFPHLLEITLDNDPDR